MLWGRERGGGGGTRAENNGDDYEFVISSIIWFALFTEICQSIFFPNMFVYVYVVARLRRRWVGI